MQLPLVLAGPIVRRATPEKIWIWIAIRDLPDYQLHLQLYEYGAAGLNPIKSEPEWYPVSLGKQLWVYMLAAMPSKPLKAGRIYEYDVTLEGKKSLFSKEELRQIVLPGFHRPSFVLGYQDRTEMRGIYASCRKLHGPNPDMMKGAEHILRQEAKSNKRPQYFFLGGDQVYADDVHPIFLTLTKPLRDALFGPTNEVIPGLNLEALTLSGKRSDYLKPFFSSGEMDHHLLTFAEYASNYLMAWNSGLWQPLAVENSRKNKNFIIDSKLWGGQNGAISARKVLANIICYMIFDDHEITDDWFLNETWETNAAKYDAAIRIMTNGMAAYWAFQGWGNDPEVFDDEYRSTISSFTEGAGQNTSAAWTILRKTDWSYIAPTSPPTLFLDTRTKRESSPTVVDDVGFGFQKRAILPYSPGILAQNIQSAPDILTAPRNTNAPRLLGAPARSRVLELIKKHVSSHEPLIVIAPSPIFGFPPLEWIQSEIGKISASSADLESWSANPRNTLDAIELFSKSSPEPLIILSGDVHYGFEVEGRIFTKAGSIPFLQLCSSALKNKVEGVHEFFFNFISRFGDKDLPFAYWDLRKHGQADGRIAYTNSNSNAAKVFNDLYGDFFGKNELYHLNSRFIKRVGRKTGKQRIEKQNNLGELVISGNTVSHRHWYAEKNGNISPRDFQTWDTSDWPVKDIIDLLLKKLEHIRSVYGQRG